MKVNLVIKQISSSGGTKMLFKYATLLRRRGHDARVVAERIKDNWAFDIEPTLISSFDPRLFPASDIIIATKSKDVLAVSKTKDSKICHLCQGLETIELEARIRGGVTPSRYQNVGFLGSLKYRMKKSAYVKKKRRIDAIYHLKTCKIAVSNHLKEFIEERYGQRCHYVPNGVDLKLFQPGEDDNDGFHAPIRIISVGSFGVTTKGMDDVLDATRLLKKRMNVILTRVSFTPITEAERDSGLIDNYYYNVSETEIADLYRKHHILIAPSLESEGFGLPAIEAMASGVPCVLTKISSYLTFDNPRDYCYFVKPRSPHEIAEAVSNIVSDREKRLRVISRGYEVAKKYSLQNTERILEKTLLEILSAN